MPDLAIIVPTRGRPENIRKVISAWDFTNAWDHADLILVADADDPEIQGYRDVVADADENLVKMVEMGEWMPMVHKLDAVAMSAALSGEYFALGFAGDDHLPQTIGWAETYLTALRELGTGMVYGDDGYQGRKLSTEWAVTADAVRALGRMVPAPVEHMYCDNSMMDLFGGAKAMRHLPQIRIEHMHPYAGKAETDAQYDRVNHRDQFKKDRRAYEGWLATGLGPDVVRIQNLRKGRPEVTNEPTPARPRVAGSAPRRVRQRRVQERSAPSSVRRQSHQGQEDRTPRHFRNVRAATPEDIMVTLADFATQVPADQEIVELGVFQGRTALQLAWGASLGHGAHVTAIDAWDLPGNTYGPPFTDADSRTWARHWVDTLGYADKIRLIQGFAVDEAAVWPYAGEHGKKVGLLFVDDDHSYDGARRAIESWAPHLAPGARIAVDDYDHPDWPGVKEAVDALVAEGVLEPIELFHDHLAVTRLAGFTVPPTPTEEEYGSLPVLDISAITSEGVHPTCYEQDHDHSGSSCQGPVTAITSEGVHPEPDEVDLLFGDDLPGSGGPEVQRPEPDSEVSRSRARVHADELPGVAAGTSIEELTTVQLRALARAREIVLGARKDKRADMLQALRAGQ
jgi:methyltransferase family protein